MIKRTTAILLGVLAAAQACSDTGRSPIGADLLPGGILEGGLQELISTEFEVAVSYTIFPGDRGMDEQLAVAHEFPSAPGFESRALMAFDVSGLDSLPAGTDIAAPRVRLVYAPAPDEPIRFQVHRLTAAWKEEAADWNRRDFGVPWATPGGDFDPTPLATFVIETVEDDSLASAADSIDVEIPLELVQGWRDGSIINDGLIVLAETSGVRLDFVAAGARGLNSNGPTLKLDVLLAGQPDPIAAPAILAANDVFVVEDESGFGGGGLVVSGAEPVRRMHLNPAIDFIPPGATVASARLVLTVENALVPGDSLIVLGRAMISPFIGEKTILAPVATNTLLGFDNVRADWVTGDTLVFEAPVMTRLFRRWLNDPARRIGFALTVVNEEAGFGGVQFFSTDAAPAVRPRLRVLIVPPTADTGTSP